MPNSPFSIQIVPVASPPRTYDFQIIQDGVILDEGYEFLWDFGDGNTSTSSVPMHTYAATGNYTISCHLEPLDDKEGGDKTGNNPPPDPPPEGLTVP